MPLTEDIKKSMRIFALDNAVSFKGKANPGAVVGKTLQEYPELKNEAQEVGKTASKITKEVNSLSQEDQKTELDALGKDLIIVKEHVKHSPFTAMRIDHDEWDGKLISSFPPEPSKYPHIGHAKAILLNYNLAKEYKGKFILRFEDTNPTLVKEEFYHIHLDNYKWLGIKPDKVVYVSDHMDTFYEKATELLKNGLAYCCTCPQEKIRESRLKGTPCRCRDQSAENNLNDFKKMATADEGSVIVRLKIDLNHKNSTMRDPTMMRIIDHPHPRTKDKYRLWPTYDFENSIMDGMLGVTHRLRSKEFEMRNELQRHIQTLLNLPVTFIYEFGRFNMEGVESSGRIIRELIEKGDLLGWDDPSLTTLVALQRRGFLPQAIASFVLKTGASKAEAVMTWDDLIMQNKRLLDKDAKRYFFVEDPVKVTVAGAPSQEVALKDLPEATDKTRKFSTTEHFYLAKSDVDSLTNNNTYRLMDCLNFTRNDKTYSFHSLDYETFKKAGTTIIHWLPADASVVKVQIMMPDKSQKVGLAEQTIKNVKVGDIIQFERVGFCRVDTVGGDTIHFWFAHS